MFLLPKMQGPALQERERQEASKKITFTHTLYPVTVDTDI